MERCDQAGRERTSGDARRELGGLVGTHAAQLDAVDVDVAAEVGAEIGELVGTRGGAVAVSPHDHEWRPGGGAHHVPQQQQRRPVRPVEVVEHDQGRLSGRDPGDEHRHRLEEPVAIGLRVLRRPQRDAGQTRQQLRERARELGFQSVDALAEGGDREGGDGRTQRLDEGLMGDHDLLVAPAVQRETRVGVDAPDQLRHQAGLADPRLAADEHDAPVAGGGVGPCVEQTRELGAAPGERGAGHAERRRIQTLECRKCVDGPQRWEIGGDPVGHQLEDVLGRGDAAEPVLTEVPQNVRVGRARRGRSTRSTARGGPDRRARSSSIATARLSAGPK